MSDHPQYIDDRKAKPPQWKIRVCSRCYRILAASPANEPKCEACGNPEYMIEPAHWRPAGGT